MILLLNRGVSAKTTVDKVLELHEYNISSIEH
jgi:hypothetical protein